MQLGAQAIGTGAEPSRDIRTSATTPDETPARDARAASGSFRMVDAGERARRLAELEEAGRLCVTIHALPPVARGLLAELVDDALARALAHEGADELGPQDAPEAGAHDVGRASPETVGDRVAGQLGRARRLGRTGIVLSLGSLARIGSPGLATEDGTTLRALALLTQRAPLDVLVDASDAERPAHLAPAPLRALSSEPPAPDAPAPASSDVVLARPRRVEPVAPAAEAAQVPVAEAAEVPAAAEPAPRKPSARVALRSGSARIEPPAVPEATARAPRTSDPDPAALRGWLAQLVRIEGPQPLATLERTFVEAYVPLARALDGGFVDPRAAKAREDFRRAFERAYETASNTFAVATKRPPLVLDAPTRAWKLGRLVGARHTVLVLVDGLRFDLGARVRAEMVSRGKGRLHEVGDEILWSTLPTTTPRQLDTLARGTEALGDARATDDLALDSLRGARADVLRRVSLGSRDVHKLDTVAAALAARPSLDDVDDAADRVGRGLADAALDLPNGTLVYVFGDHGFLLGRGGAREGFASPDEVLVPAFGMLVLSSSEA